MFYKSVIRPILFLLSPEAIHNFLFLVFRYCPFIGRIISLPLHLTLPKATAPVEAFGLRFRHPVGLAGGMDKKAIALRFLRNVGFSFIEVGTVTPMPQKGNPKPRLFRLKRNAAMINRMGFNNPGVVEMAKHLKNRPSGVIIGGNIGKNTLTGNDQAWQDYAICFNELYPWVDYFVVNVSCPNIKDLSKLQNKDSLAEILQHLTAIRREKETHRPILMKISPDLSFQQLDEVIGVIRSSGIEGVVATNTSIRRFGLDYSQEELDRFGEGGLSGAPLRATSTGMIRYLRENLG
ncbi:MAG: quinone-dependent dihydroorotate dehydrogenase, partial [Bacteroidales bacterium]